MELTLSTLSHTFVTRERARSVVESLGAEDVPTITIDMTNVSVSPSFTAELLTRLTMRFMQIEVVGASEAAASLVRSLSSKLGLNGRVTVNESVVLANA